MGDLCKSLQGLNELPQNRLIILYSYDKKQLIAFHHSLLRRFFRLVKIYFTSSPLTVPLGLHSLRNLRKFTAAIS